MNNTTEPRLPEIPLYQNTEREILEGIFTLLPLLLFVTLPIVYIIGYALKLITAGIYKKITKCCKTSREIDCSTELKWIDRSQKCGECTGNCTCLHKNGRMEADIV